MTAGTAAPEATAGYAERRAFQKGLSAKHLRRFLDALDQAEAPVLFAAGGSGVTRWATPTSDFDFFYIGGENTGKRLVDALWTREGFDIERRGPDWLTEIGRRLDAYRPNVACELPPFSTDDLRFLVRIRLGRMIRCDEDTSAAMDRLAPGLARACAGWASVMFAGLYQDAVGLLLAGRAEETVPLAGELLQRACLAALLQRGIVADLSFKWAVGEALAGSGGPEVAAAAERAFARLAAVNLEQPSAWLRGFLAAARAIPALAVLERISAPGLDKPGASCVTGPATDAADLRYTVVAALSGQVLYDTVRRLVSPCGVAAIHALAAFR